MVGMVGVAARLSAAFQARENKPEKEYDERPPVYLFESDLMESEQRGVVERRDEAEARQADSFGPAETREKMEVDVDGREMLNRAGDTAVDYGQPVGRAQLGSVSTLVS